MPRRDDISLIESLLYNMTSVWPLRSGTLRIHLPAHDPLGDPAPIHVTRTGDDALTVDGGGAVAGMLFSSDTDAPATPQRELLDRLAACGAAINFDDGAIEIHTDQPGLGLAILNMLALSITMLTASPHLPQSPKQDADQHGE